MYTKLKCHSRCVINNQFNYKGKVKIICLLLGDYFLINELILY